MLPSGLQAGWRGSRRNLEALEVLAPALGELKTQRRDPMPCVGVHGTRHHHLVVQEASTGRSSTHQPTSPPTLELCSSRPPLPSGAQRPSLQASSGHPSARRLAPSRALLLSLPLQHRRRPSDVGSGHPPPPSLESHCFSRPFSPSPSPSPHHPEEAKSAAWVFVTHALFLDSCIHGE